MILLGVGMGMWDGIKSQLVNRHYINETKKTKKNKTNLNN